MELFIKIRREKFLGRGDIVLRNPTDTSRSWVRIIIIMFVSISKSCLRNVKLVKSQSSSMVQLSLLKSLEQISAGIHTASCALSVKSYLWN